jgi:glutathione-specific gamma-glutamylcyclotransferase
MMVKASMNEAEIIERRRLAPPPGEDFWLFAYGSLMWNPGFRYLESHPALVRGYHRAFCVHSVHYRGTPARPGLVLGLDRGGACRGRAYKVAAVDGKRVTDYLHEREMITGIYEPRWLKVLLLPASGSPMEVPSSPASAGRTAATPRSVRAAAYIVDRRHKEYAGKLAPAEVAERIRQGTGSAGSNVAYLENTVRHLDELGVVDCPLHGLLKLVETKR